MDTLFATWAVPINSVANKLADGKDAALVKAMYAEFQKSGKVRATLPEDDKEVRALYAMEVLKTPISTLNAKWPREIGLAHGDGEPEPAPKAKPKPAPKPAPAPKAEKSAPQAAPVMATNDPRLHREDPIVDAPSIGAKTAARLEAVGLKTVADLLDAEPEHAAKSVKASHITPPVIRTWQAQAMLACAIPSLRGFDAQALVGAGIRELDQLAGQTPHGLQNAIAMFLKTNEGKQLARSSKPATPEAIAGWIEAAQKNAA
jgi:hypothetical protein